MRRHLSKHWHHHVALWGTLIALLLASSTTAVAYQRWHGNGYVPGPLPPVVQIGGSPRLPASWWLNRYVARVHNQGNSNSCVGQTLSTMEEITQAERDIPHARWHKKFSSGFIWNQANGGHDVGITYEAAFGVLLKHGDARLKDFPHDGREGYWIWPSPAAFKAALPYRFISFRSILPTDRRTIEFEISHGRPIAVALPILSSFYNHWQTPSWITGESGSFLFWHSLTIIGYNPWGVELLNSWGTQWGDGGHAMLTWGALAALNGALVIAQPRTPPAGSMIPPLKAGRLGR
jgi:hypothetical protein